MGFNVFDDMWCCYAIILLPCPVVSCNVACVCVMCSDGGCTCPGDFSKAFGAGTDFVMSGGMFAAHTESGGELETGEDGRQYKAFYGMSSSVAMNKHSGGVANYRASEGKAVRLPFRGPVAATISDVLGGLRSSCTYVGAR